MISTVTWWMRLGRGWLIWLVREPLTLRRYGARVLRYVVPDVADAADAVALEREERRAQRTRAFTLTRNGDGRVRILTFREPSWAGFDSQIKTAQLAYKIGLQDAIRLCFQMDEKLWGSARKEVSGQFAGSPYSVSYTPAKDIAGNHTVDVPYGFAAGMDPNRAVVMMLQLRADKLFSRDYMARQLPFEYDVGEEFTKISVEGRPRGHVVVRLRLRTVDPQPWRRWTWTPEKPSHAWPPSSKASRRAAAWKKSSRTRSAPAPQPSPAEATPEPGLGGEPAGVGGRPDPRPG
jgi:hypothetical protein